MIPMESLTQQALGFLVQNRKDFRLRISGLNFSHLLSDDFGGRPFQFRIHETCEHDLFRKHIRHQPQLCCKVSGGLLQGVDLRPLQEAVGLDDAIAGAVDLRARQLEETYRTGMGCIAQSIVYQD